MSVVSVGPTDRVLTIPNGLSVLRLLVLPVFVWLALVRHEDGWAGLLIGVAALSDNLDGYIARHFDQVSRLGQLLDPTVDRLVVFTTLVVLVAVGALPWPLAMLIVVRELLLVLLLLVLRVRGFGSLPVNYLGKIATFALVFSFPFLLAGHGVNTVPWIADAAVVLGWACFGWGICLYWAAAALYVGQGVRLLRSGRGSGRTGAPPDAAPPQIASPAEGAR